MYQHEQRTAELLYFFSFSDVFLAATTVACLSSSWLVFGETSQNIWGNNLLWAGITSQGSGANAPGGNTPVITDTRESSSSSHS